MMDMKRTVFAIGAAVLVLAVVLPIAEPTPVMACKGDAKAENGDIILNDVVSVANCPKPPCRFRRKTSSSSEFRFTAPHDIKTLRNEVSATIFGIPFPFLGTDGTNACNNIYLADGATKVQCPLKAGTEYIYKISLNILEVYPRIKSMMIHWALVADDGSKPVCFNMPAKIV